MSKLIEVISKALAETENLQRTIEGMADGDLKEEQKKRAQKLKGDLLKDLLRESKPIWIQISMNVEKREGG